MEKHCFGNIRQRCGYIALSMSQRDNSCFAQEFAQGAQGEQTQSPAPTASSGKKEYAAQTTYDTSNAGIIWNYFVEQFDNTSVIDAAGIPAPIAP